MNPVQTMPVQTMPVHDLDALRSACPGGVVSPDDEGWDATRLAFNARLDQQPVAVALPATADEVAAVMAHAAERGLRVVPQTTGHNAAPLGSLQDAILLKTTNLRWVELDAERRTARVGGGARWEDVTGPAAELGLAALHGSSPDVGIVGYSTGGGMGWYARKHGLQCNHVLAVELVTPDGRQLRASADEHPDLFWALRGGGGNFGVVTAIEFELLPIEQVYAGALFFPWERAAEVLKTWHGLLDTLPEEMTSVGRILQVPPMPDVPEPLRGRGFVVVEATHLGTQGEGEALLKPLRDLGPEIDTFAVQPPSGIAELHMDPRSPVPAASGHVLTTELDDATLDEIVALAGAHSTSPLVSFELRHTGGALARREEHHGARDHLPGSLAMFAVGIAFDDAAAKAIEERVDALLGVLAPYAAGHYANFVETRFAFAETFGTERWERLQRVRADYDPARTMQANHAID
jgi:FAD/FMN-containing dehydrogenase